jgi:hypothetical protein
MLMGLYLSSLKFGCLLDEGSQLGHPLLGSGKLCGHLLAQPCHLDEAILGVLLLT